MAQKISQNVIYGSGQLHNYTDLPEFALNKMLMFTVISGIGTFLYCEKPVYPNNWLILKIIGSKGK
jgi:hypothetical protein